MNQRLWAACGVAICVIAIGALARAEARPGTIPRSRLHLALGGGSLVGLHLAVDGTPTAEPNDPRGSAAQLAAGFDRSLTDWFSGGVEARVRSWDSGWSEAAGYQRDCFDLNAVPRFQVANVVDIGAPFTLYAAFPVGLTWPVPPSRPERAVRETWSAARGFNAGGEIGGEVWLRHSSDRYWIGIGVSVGYVFSSMALTATFTPVSDSTAATSEGFRYLTQQIFVKGTLSIGFPGAASGG